MKLHIAGAYYSSTCLSTYISVVSTERIELLLEGFACIGVFSLFFFSLYGTSVVHVKRTLEAFKHHLYAVLPEK